MFAVLRPFNESVTCVSNGCYSALFPFHVVAATRHCSANVRIGRDINIIGVRCLLLEIRYQRAVARHGKGIVGVGRDHVAVFGPVHEGVTICRGGDYCAGLAVIICATACSTTAVARIGRDCDGVGNVREVSHQVAVGLNSEGIAGICGDHCAILCPVGKSIACVGCGSHSAALSVVVCAGTTHRTTITRIGGCSDGVSLLLEMSHIFSRLSDGKGIAGVGGDLGAVLRPIDKGITWVSRRCQSARSAVVVCVSAAHRSTRRRVGCGSDGIGVESEVGHQSAVTCNIEGIAGVRGSHIAAFSPVGERIARVSRSRDGAALSSAVFSTTCDGAALSRIGIDCNVIGRDSDGYLLGILSNHGIVGGDDTDAVLSIGHIGNLCSDTAAGICGDTSQFRRIVETAVSIRQLCDNCIGSGIEVVRRHGSCQREGDINGISSSITIRSQVPHAEGGIVNEQNIIHKQIVIGAACARRFVGGSCHEDVAHIGAWTSILERDA